MRPEPRVRFRRLMGKYIASALLVIMAVSVLFVIHVRRYGVPPFLAAKILGRMSSSQFLVEASLIRLRFPDSVILEDVRLFRKSVVGPPAVEMERIDVSIDPFSLFADVPLLKRIELSEGEIRPGMFGTPQSAAKPTAAPQEASSIEYVLRCRDCSVLGMNVNSLECIVRQSGERLTFANIMSVLTNSTQSGTLGGTIEYDSATGTLSAGLATRLDPHMLVPLLKAWNAPFLERLVGQFEFPKDAPTCDVKFTRTSSTNSQFDLVTQFWTKDMRYLGVDVLRADGTVTVRTTPTNWLVKVSPLDVMRQEGSAIAGFSIIPDSGTVEFEGVSFLNPAALLRMAWVFTNNEMNICTFDGPVRISAKGSFDYRNMSNTDFSATFDGRNVGITNFMFDECFFRMRMQGLSNCISDVSASIYGGDISGSGAVVLPVHPQSNIWYSLSANLNNADFTKFTGIAHGAGESLHGELSAQLSLSGMAGPGTSKTVTGVGSLQVSNGRVFTLPVFGGLSAIMARIIPGLDFVLRQTDAQAAFTVSDGCMHTDKLSIEGDILSIQGGGDFRFDKSLDFDMRLTLMKDKHLLGKILRFISYPFSKLFEFRLRGTYDNAKWYPVNLSKDLLKKLHLSSKGVE